ncbi:hypothetical protein SCACP_08740 [Sporomusa carbonis]|uniref:helix-turn-helix domain-containing protein n=1 Tax=Sporomusa carbonis TaxID=3076075 RepID=UPI003A6E9557
MFDIGSRIRELRAERGISAKEIAISLNVTPSFISGIEKGNNKCSLENLERICNVLGITISDFFAQGKPDLEPDLQRLLDAAKRLTPDEREYLTKFIEARKDE